MKALQRTLITTGDGSHSIAIPGAGLTFHSKHGAIGESRHIFIEAGLNSAKEVFPDEPLHILEMGFGTGLNAFLTAIEASVDARPILYSAIDAYPLDVATTAALNYPDHLGHEALFNAIQAAPWGAPVSIHDSFSIHKQSTDLLDYSCHEQFHLIYFDAFSPEAQPQLWTEEVFRKLGACMHHKGALVTYCSKSSVRRAMQAAGWLVEKLAGPYGKREMVRAAFHKDSM